MTSKHTQVGVGVLIIRDGCILLGKRKGAHEAGKWAPPGGHVEYMEPVGDTAARELFEETGLRAKSIRSGPYTEERYADKHYITLFCFAEAEGEPDLREPERCAVWQWQPIEGLRHLELALWMEHLLLVYPNILHTKGRE